MPRQHQIKAIHRITVMVALCCYLYSGQAMAQQQLRDLQVLARTLGFLSSPLEGSVRVGIVYDPSITSAEISANAIESSLRNNTRVGTVRFEPVLVPIAQAQEADVDLFLLGSGNPAQLSQLGTVLRDRKLPCFTFDLDQVNAGNCMVGLQAQPRVEIYLNREMAEQSGIAFASIFRMMIKEI